MKITVFTPTYNRAYIIENLYRSLQRQTCTDFEWLVVDDGSTDNTSELFTVWQQEDNPFPIRYYRQENGGKHRAINYGLGLAAGELFFTVDSDDYLTNDALEKIVHWVTSLPVDEKYCGVAGNLGTTSQQTPNRLFADPFFDGTALDRYSFVDGERAMVFFTDIHRKYLYPTFPGENFMTEAVVWNRMAHDGYKVRFFNDIIWIYAYQEDGLTKAGNALFLKNPQGYCLWLREKCDALGESRWKLRYSLTCELSSLYSAHEIADYFHTSYPAILLLRFVHKLLSLVKGEPQ